jgi:hypothetical protein
MSECRVKPEVDMIDLYEQMLFERASKGIRPVLYLSSSKDLECSMIMLLNEDAEDCLMETEQPTSKRYGYQVITN